MVYRIKQGLDIPLEGAPKQEIVGRKAAGKVALLGADYVGMKPTMKVREGDVVKIGDPLFECKKTPGLIYTSPAAGEVLAVKRGPRRAFEAVEIAVSSEEGRRDFASYAKLSSEGFTREGIVELMVESGMWTALRERPFSKIPAPGSPGPRAIFVTAMDTNPLACNPVLVIAQHAKAFREGVEILSYLTEGPVHVVKGIGAGVDVPTGERIKVHEFSGPHPAGNVGTHIHFIDPVSPTRRAWHMGYQDVIALGKLFASGELFVERTLSLAGPGAVAPKIVTARLGASLDDILEEEVCDDPVRRISGSVLSGHAKGYLGRYHNQVSLVREAEGREFLGWCSPGLRKFSAKRIYLSWLGAAKKFPLTTDQGGSLRAIVAVGSYESVMPLDILPTQLLRALASGDADDAGDLGCLELDEEDLALCTFVCPGKIDYGPLLRECLELIEKEG